MRFSVLTFGCRANQAESHRIEQALRAAGGVPASPGSAELVVVNTCSVTAAADADARRAIRSVARASPGARIVATGCYATRRPGEVAALPGVARLFHNAEKQNLPAAIVSSGGVSLSASTAESEILPDGFSPRPGDRGRTAYPLIVQTGCDQRCAYCVVPSTRGPGRSRPMREVLEQVRALSKSGFKQVWLTGVHLGSYGRDLEPPRRLADLLAALDREPASADLMFRLSSLEPMDCSDEVIDLVAESPRFAPHLHLPLQHASDRMLAAMRRPYTAERFQAILTRVRQKMPDAAIGTDLIAGFPGETESDFDEQARALTAFSPAYAHVFPYSNRPGTEASGLAPQVPGPTVRHRAEVLRGIAGEARRQFVAGQLGCVRPALTIEDGSAALTDNYLKLGIAGGRARNERIRVRIVSARPLLGEVVA